MQMPRGPAPGELDINQKRLASIGLRSRVRVTDEQSCLEMGHSRVVWSILKTPSLRKERGRLGHPAPHVLKKPREEGQPPRAKTNSRSPSATLSAGFRFAQDDKVKIGSSSIGSSVEGKANSRSFAQEDKVVSRTRVVALLIRLNEMRGWSSLPA